MSLPPEIDAQILKRFEELLTEAERLNNIMWKTGEKGSNYFASLFTLNTNVLSLLNFLKTTGDHISKLMDLVDRQSREPSPTELLGIVKGLKSDYESGLLNNLAQTIEANVAADYLGQAEQLLSEGQAGKYDHVPAAVLIGAILEDGLRRLCQRQTPPIPTERPNGEPKTLSPLIDDLKKASVFNELKAKQLRAWADIRNSAAHGEFSEFKREDVEQMIKGVQNFLADYL